MFTGQSLDLSKYVLSGQNIAGKGNKLGESFFKELALTKSSLRWPPMDPGGDVGTVSNGYVQCTSCHDPHGSRSEKLPFWNKETFSQVCQVCHAY